ncbi:maleylacetoacetate isomerase [Novosphingobium sp.]|jgi:maleylacetoacetate isomerase|uniref:maleylacetoacetate isomerase n=1 Tax=Novosphingobium sp. TaxID=1874826 RepID=UPI0022C3DFE0|nr:maleylacetoacetate isomerase [Novosphingobium sp.]MCZ8324722.1 maleylacetoacetate isomerase [Sphingomonadaceae bacterium]MCZ8020061.1 maleylacetoacetate isomerase [Novosphingobium sp.]MCZ8035706.1 maleylacetoacetate isomerase [Novosphingobium sp.]MCZ8053104.1 maleylacetoacetate isomerase [Novosphingobium sp.]MCZ8061101.1 maleylacetoacetate isomerase [Novosphingobium sp.]
MSELVLHDYWRSSASYRVRIALSLKGLSWTSHQVDLVTGEQSGEDHRARNPLGLVPVLEVDGEAIAQSLAIIDYLDARWPEPRLLPADPLARALVLGRAMTIISEIHPLQNLRVLNYLRGPLGQDEAGVTAWLHRWLGQGLAALEAVAPEHGLFGGAEPNLIDVCLVPQMYSARRFALPLEPLPRLVRIDEALRARPDFAAAAPEAVKPA